MTVLLIQLKDSLTTNEKIVIYSTLLINDILVWEIKLIKPIH